MNPFSDFMIGKFDLVMATGVFMDAHLPDIGFDEAHALLKTGGHFITSIRQYYFTDGHEFGSAAKEPNLAEKNWLLQFRYIYSLLRL